MGGIWSPYTGQKFGTLKQTHIEHIVASSEAHDSGLCSADPKTRGRFAEDLANLTFASPYVRHVKRAKDAAGWLPKKGKLHT